MKKSILSEAAKYKLYNDIASAHILADPEKWGGEQAASVQWARLHAARNAVSSHVKAPRIDLGEQGR